jgi:tubulin--tyrosine ligase-like protein 12
LTGCYRLASTEQLDESSCWYVNDELGSSIPHSDKPKVKLVPFLYAPNNKLDDKVVSYTLMWPLEEINEGDTITRDYLNGLK